MNNKHFLFYLLIPSLIFSIASFAQKVDMKKLEGIKPRSIGPAAMSGRVTAFGVLAANPDIIYAGSASGGLWKSESGGIYWEPVFDKEPTQSIGAISIFQKNPDVIWIGSGEGNPRNSVSSGNGVYRSLDAGKTWEHLGLENTRNIHRIIVHPENQDIVYVGATGFPWGESSDRGIYKTTDGGKTWEKILYVNETTGAGDMVMDPVNPNKIFAGMWDHYRWPWYFRSGGPGSGLYLTIDGGKNWKKLSHDDGLPEGELGRIGIAISRSQPNVVYAIIESKKNGIYRSDDGGYKWRKVADKSPVDRPFYYAEIYVDPMNENRVYNLTSYVSVSEDGGKNFQNLLPGLQKGNIHVDHHAWYVSPYDPNFLIDGNDGGMAISRDKGKTWQFIENLPLGQYYHINVDNEIPYNVYGGMQDNGSWIGPAYVWRNGNIRNGYWQELGFGDGFDVVPDPENSRFGYCMSQEGRVVRYDAYTGFNKLIRPLHPDSVELRFNWNAAIAQDPFDKSIIYFGSQFVHKSTNKGDSWTIISPDLTTNNPERQQQKKSGGLTYDVTGAENHTTILCISPSPVKQGIIWVGTDDGNIQVTSDGGQNWTNVIRRIRDVPEGSWVPQIKPSDCNAEEAFAVINNYRRNDWNPYVYHTCDLGKTWERIVDGTQVSGYALSFIQDPVEPRLMFMGTEFGLYLSIDKGKNWTKWDNGYPSVSTMDLVIQPREHDLVIGTFGRSAYILDDIRPLRVIASKGPAVLDEPIHIFPPPDAWLAKFQQPPGPRCEGDAVFTGENRPYGAMISYSVKDTLSGAKVKMEILNTKGEVIRTNKIVPKPGMNRSFWDLERKGVRRPGSTLERGEDYEPGGPSVLPGTYKVRLIYKNKQDSATIIVHLDPRINFSMENLIAANQLQDEIMKYSNTAADAFDQLKDAQKAVDMILNQIGEDTIFKELKKSSLAIKDSLQSLSEMFTGREKAQGILSGEERITRYLWQAQYYISSSPDAPGENARTAISLLKKDFGKGLDRINRFFDTEWANYRQKVDRTKLTPFKESKKFLL